MTNDLCNQDLHLFLNALTTTNKPFIVEGKKDKLALNQLGISRVIVINKPLYKLVEQISEKYREIIIFTDLDKEGKQLYGKLKPQLEAHGVKIDRYFREFLYKNTKISNIESLSEYLKSRLEDLELGPLVE